MQSLRVAGPFAVVLVLGSVGAGQQPDTELSFPAVLFTATGNYAHEVSAAYGEFTLAGPKTDTLKTLPKGMRHVACDPGEQQLYGISNHEVYQIDLVKGEAVEMKLPADLPPLSWPCGIAFDTKRDRVLVVTLGGTGHLYSFTPKTGKWALICDVNNMDLTALTYDAAVDRLYGLWPGEGKPTVAVFNAAGAVVGTIKLADPAFPALLAQASVGPPVQLMAVGGELGVITEDQILAGNLKTKKVRVTWTRK